MKLGLRLTGTLAGCAVVGAMLFMPVASAKKQPAHPYRLSLVDIPVSLAVGTVRTPVFMPKKTSFHFILLQVEKPLPFHRMICMVGVGLAGGVDPCPDLPSLVDAEWTVFADGEIVYRGSDSGPSPSAKFTKDNVFRFLGQFPATMGKKYELEVKFKKDGKALDAANPHLIVTKVHDE